ncbi:TRAP transporter small permease [Pseudorhodobacter sp. W20_MBD10_FR17]|uniref:TRAP transporter small permease n=1 Tax=Pseudorhodobacter sp. W20_MBD10_FR17 TaxID=3240266 RepID=UPI003F958A38
MRHFFKVCDGIFAGATVVSFVAACIAVLLTITDIGLRLASGLMRAVTGQGTNWAVNGLVDLTQLAVMTCASFGIAVAFSRSNHVNIDLVTTFLPAPFRNLLTILAGVLGLGLVAAILWAGIGEIEAQFAYPSRSATLGISYIWYWLALLSGFSCSLLGALYALLKYVSNTSLTEDNAHV